MTEPPGFDLLIHEPRRLRICAMLVPAAAVEFGTLRDTLGVSDSALSKHLSALEQAGYVRTARTLRAARQRVWVELTDNGRVAFDGHVRALRAILASQQPAPQPE